MVLFPFYIELISFWQEKIVVIAEFYSKIFKFNVYLAHKKSIILIRKSFDQMVIKKSFELAYGDCNMGTSLTTEHIVFSTTITLDSSEGFIKNF